MKVKLYEKILEYQYEVFRALHRFSIIATFSFLVLSSSCSKQNVPKNDAFGDMILFSILVFES